MRGSKSVEIIDRSEYGHLGVEPFVVDAVEIGTFEYKLGIINICPRLYNQLFYRVELRQKK